jgi:hypothetical protein
MTTSAFDFRSAVGLTAGGTVRVTERTIARAIWAAAIAVYIALAAGTAMTRQPYGDEGELASPAYNLVHRGHLEVTQWERARESHKAYWMPPVFFFAQAAWQMLAGFGVVQFRLGTVLWGLVLIVAAGAIVRRMTDDAILAALIAVALATDYTYLMHAGIGRCEIMSAALAILASAVYLAVRERSLLWAVFGSHALMTLSGLTHPVGGMMWMPCLLGLQLSLDHRRLRLGHYLAGALPYLLGMSGWGLYIVQDPAEFRRQFFGISLSEHRFAGLADPLTAIRREIGRFVAYYGVRPNASWAVRLKVMLPLGYVIGVLGALLIPSVRKQRFVRSCLILLAVQMFILTFIEGTKQSHYISHVIPTFVALLVATLWTLSQRSSMRRPVLVAALVLVIVQVGPVLFRIHENPYRNDWLPAIEIARPYVERNLYVIGGPEFAVPFNFPENVVSRPDYGYAAARSPDLVLTSIGQFQRNTALTRSDPKFHHYMTITFFERYRLIYQRNDVAVYKRVL